MRTITIICLLFLCVQLFAQKDYIVTNDNDTIYGKLKKPLFGGLRLVKGDDEIQVKADSIKLIYRDKTKETACSKSLPGSDRLIFLDRIQDGKIRLYSYTITYNTGTSTYSTTTWYGEKDGIPLDEIKTSGLRGGKQDRKDFFLSLIADDPEITQKYNDGKFKLKTLLALVEEYNKKHS